MDSTCNWLDTMEHLKRTDYSYRLRTDTVVWQADAGWLIVNTDDVMENEYIKSAPPY